MFFLLNIFVPNAIYFYTSKMLLEFWSICKMLVSRIYLLNSFIALHSYIKDNY